MEYERKKLISGNYLMCIIELSKNGVQNGTHWLIIKNKENRNLYKCAHENCTCKAELKSELDDDNEVSWNAYQIGIHHDH